MVTGTCLRYLTYLWVVVEMVVWERVYYALTIPKKVIQEFRTLLGWYSSPAIYLRSRLLYNAL